MRSFPSALVSLSLPLSALAQSYTLKTSYQGDNFFNQWNFSTAADRNFGFASFQSSQVAQQQKLAFLNSAGNAILKVDNTTVGNPADTTFGRASVYLQSNDAVELGSLVLFDAVHVPFGCSVWPAFFMQGTGDWPLGGEIDLFENVNQATANQYSLHTFPAGCTAAKSTESGQVVSTDCFNNTNSNQGCIVKETTPASFGKDFNSNGGGGFAASFDSTGIKMWFFPRSKLPSDWTSSSPNPSNWPTPSAFYPASSCDPTKFFTAQTLILDIDICGAFAGDGGAFSQTCSGHCVDLLKTPTNYDEAYFEIPFIKVFTQGGSGGNGGSSTSTSKPTGSFTGSTPSSTTSKGAASGLVTSWASVGIVTALAMVFATSMSMSMTI